MNELAAHPTDVPTGPASFLTRRRFLCACLFVLGFTLYAFNLDGRLFWDDEDWIIKNSRVHDISVENIEFLFTHDILAPIGQKSDFYRPVLSLTFMANWQMAEWMEPEAMKSGKASVIAEEIGWIFHLTNNLIHIANAILLFLLLDRFLQRRAVAFLAATFFLIHPLQTEAVGFVAGRGDSLSVLFMLCSLITWLWGHGYWYRSDVGPVRKWGLTGVALGFAAMAFLSRETGFLFPGYFAVFLFALVHRDSIKTSIWNSLRDATPFIIISAIYVILRLTVLNFQNTLDLGWKDTDYANNIEIRIMTFLRVLLVYYRMIVAPYDLHMEHTLPDFVRSPDGWTVLSVLLLAGITYWAFSDARKSRLAVLITGWFFINLSLTSGILIPVNALMHEHWLYFSLAGAGILFAVVLVDGFLYLWQRSALLARIALVPVAAWTGWICTVTMQRNMVWTEVDRFYEEILAYGDQLDEARGRVTLNVRVTNNLGMFYAEKGRWEEAERTYRRLTDNGVETPVPYHNLANLYLDTGRKNEAIRMYAKAIDMQPTFTHAYDQLLPLLLEAKHWSSAEQTLLRFFKHIGRTPLALYWYGISIAQQGRKQEGRLAIEEGLRAVDPDSQLGNMMKQVLEQLK